MNTYIKIGCAALMAFVISGCREKNLAVVTADGTVVSQPAPPPSPPSPPSNLPVKFSEFCGNGMVHVAWYDADGEIVGITQKISGGLSHGSGYGCE